MKKLLSAITSIVLCGLMLTACGSNDAAETTDSAAADTTVAEETQAAEEETEATEEAAEETEAESEENAEAAGEGYADLEAFSAADVFAIAGEEVEASSSNVYGFYKNFENATDVYADMSYVGSGITVKMAATPGKIAMKTSDPASGTNMWIIITDTKMYMLDENQKAGYSYTVDEAIKEEYGSALDGVSYEGNLDEMGAVKTTTVEIGGESYTFEVVADNNAGYLFDADGTLAAMITSTDGTVAAFEVNAFTTEVPADVFEVPSDYSIIDADALAE